MSKSRRVNLALACCCVLPLLPAIALAAAAPPDGAVHDEGDINVLDRTFVSCESRFAAIFPSDPMVKDLTFTVGGKSAPARQFYLNQDGRELSVTVANFADGPAVDEELVEGAAVPLRQRGRILFQFDRIYDPGIPGRQINLVQPDGLQLRASVYMADHHLYLTQSVAPQGDFTALQFEQSVSIIDAKGVDLDKNGTAPSRVYICK